MTNKEDSKEPDLESAGTITDTEKEIGLDSFSKFSKNDYDGALQLLKELASKRSNDPKILHNIGIAEFYSSKLRYVDKFEKVLENIRNIYQLDINNSDRLEDIAHCVLYFNQAVIYYHQHKYQTAIDLMNKIFDFIEPLDMDFKKKILFLFIELYLCIYEPKKAHNLINYADKLLFQQPSDSKIAESKNLNSTSSDQFDISVFKPKLLQVLTYNYNQYKVHQYRVRSYMMLKSTKACKREIKSLSSSGLVSQASYLKANMEYLRGNYKKAVRVLNSVAVLDKPNFQETGENQNVYYYNNMGCIYFYLGKPNLSYHYFNKASKENNNEFKKLSDTFNEDHSMKNLPLPVVSGNMQAKLLYNIGIACLHAGQPLNAFEYLIKVAKVYKSNPRLWLRIAECCIKVHKMTNEVDFKKPEKEVQFVKKIVGSGEHRKVILTANIGNKNESEIRNTTHGPNLQFAAICLKNALFLTKLPCPQPGNSDSSGQKTEQVEDQDKSSQIIGNNATNDAETPEQFIRAMPVHSMNIAEITSLRTSILTASSYVNLVLEDPVLALHYAEEVLKQPKLLSMHRYLAHMYAAEAMIKLDRLSEAIDYLNYNSFGPDFNISSNIEIEKGNIESNTENHCSSSTLNKEIDKSWFPTSTTTAQNAMQYNLTVSHTLRGELDKAQCQLQKMIESTAKNGSDIPIQAPILSAYIQLQSASLQLGEGGAILDITPPPPRILDMSQNLYIVVDDWLYLLSDMSVKQYGQDDW
ncbi:CCR4-NOT transcription complex subunit 10 [Nymphon striatum]|nr:CCR4-NOT transcription complex subunit 10 [Nymphon striatum]